MNTNIRLAYPALLLALAGCSEVVAPGIGGDNDRVIGSGNVVAESRAVSGFNAVTVRGVARVILRQCEEESLTITAEDNVLERIASVVVDGELVLGPPDDMDFRTHHDIVYEISVIDLRAVRLRGVIKAEVRDVDTDVLEIDLDGVNNLRVVGSTGRQIVTLAGVSAYDADRLQSREATVDGDGVLTVELSVSDRLDGFVCGVGSVTYTGDPELGLKACHGVGVNRR